MSRLQVISKAPQGDTLSQSLRYRLPPSGVMPGTIKYQGRMIVHMHTSDNYEEFIASLPPSWEAVAAQEFKLTYDYDEDGNVTAGPHGVYLEIPHSFVNYLPDKVEYDENGNEIGRTPAQVGQPLHTFLGADQWVWAQGEPVVRRQLKKRSK